MMKAKCLEAVFPILASDSGLVTAIRLRDQEFLHEHRHDRGAIRARRAQVGIRTLVSGLSTRGRGARLPVLFADRGVSDGRSPRRRKRFVEPGTLLEAFRKNSAVPNAAVPEKLQGCSENGCGGPTAPEPPGVAPQKGRECSRCRERLSRLVVDFLDVHRKAEAQSLIPNREICTGRKHSNARVCSEAA